MEVVSEIIFDKYKEIVVELNESEIKSALLLYTKIKLGIGSEDKISSKLDFIKKIAIGSNNFIPEVVAKISIYKHE